MKALSVLGAMKTAVLFARCAGAAAQNNAVPLSPTAVNFGSQNIGTISSAALTTLSNIAATAVSITSIAIAGTDPKDFLEANNCGSSLSANASCTIEVKFKPTATPRTAAVSITDNGGASPQTVALSGTGTRN